ncbi:hypothetical protein Hanom_Chr02g00131371 [Helianthus anomalus]
MKILSSGGDIVDVDEKTTAEDVEKQTALARETDWHPNHNIYCILDENYPNMELFKEIIPFLKESRIFRALTEKHKCYESHVRMFWKSARYDEEEQTIYSTVRMKDEENKDTNVEVTST